MDSLDRGFIEFFRKMQERAHKVNVDNGFWEEAKSINSKLRALLMIHTEVSEAVEIARSIDEDSDEYNDLFTEEIADIVIRCMDLSEAFGLNLGEHISMKIEYNKGRRYRHGKNF